ncbi:Putative Superoxide dismutase [Cu-Zn] [Rhizopus microsporus]|nr:Putative Superoxide dismutase [Cu-Zn] [Rhizopus microsporus]
MSTFPPPVPNHTSGVIDSHEMQQRNGFQKLHSVDNTPTGTPLEQQTNREYFPQQDNRYYSPPPPPLPGQPQYYYGGPPMGQQYTLLEPQAPPAAILPYGHNRHPLLRLLIGPINTPIFSYLSAIAMAGVIHFLMNMLTHLRLGVDLERALGTPRYVILYMASGIWGFVLSAMLSQNLSASTGCSGALFGLIGYMFIDVLVNWKILPHPVRDLMSLLVSTIISLVLGLLPGLDNFAHIVYANLTGLTGGDHGIHIHEFGDLSQGCNSTGAHYNPFNQTHGGPDAEVRHVGDLGNIVADNTTGLAILNITSDLIQLSMAHSVIGRAVVVHSGKDDYGLGGTPLSNSTGNSGSRVACGVIGYASLVA